MASYTLKPKDEYLNNRIVCLGDPVNLHFKLSSEGNSKEKDIVVRAIINGRDNEPYLETYKEGDNSMDIGDLLRKGDNLVTLEIQKTISATYHIYAVDWHDEDGLKKLVGYDLMLAYVKKTDSDQSKSCLSVAHKISTACEKWKKEIISRDQLINSIEESKKGIISQDQKRKNIELPKEIDSLIEDLKNTTTILDPESARNRSYRLHYRMKRHYKKIEEFQLALENQYEPNAGEQLAKKAMEALGYTAASLLTKMETKGKTVKLISYSEKEITIDFSKIIPLAKHCKTLPYISERQRDLNETQKKGNSENSKQKPKIIFCYKEKDSESDTEEASGQYVYGNVDCSLSSYSLLINNLFEQKPLRMEFAYLLIYLSLALDKNLSVLDRINCPNICDELNKLNEKPEASKKIEELATRMLDSLGALSSFQIDPKLSYFELEEQGWRFHFDNSEDRQTFLAYYKKPGKPSIYAKNLERSMLHARKPDEYAFFFRGNSGSKGRAAKDLLMAISTISPKVIFNGQSNPEISFTFTFSPLFEACSKYIQENLDKIISKSNGKYKEYSYLDLILFLGRQAQQARDGKHVFFKILSDKNIDLEQQMLFDTIEAGILEKIRILFVFLKNTYVFFAMVSIPRDPAINTIQKRQETIRRAL